MLAIIFARFDKSIIANIKEVIDNTNPVKKTNNTKDGEICNSNHRIENDKPKNAKGNTVKTILNRV